MTAEEVTLLLTLQDRASAGVTAFQARVQSLGMAGAVAERGLSLAGKGVEALASKASTMMDKLVSKTITLAKWAAVAGAGFAAWEIKSGVQINAQVEQFTKTLERLTGSALRAREMTRAALGAAGTSPFALTDILEATQALTAMGADAGKWLKPLQDVAAGTRRSLIEVVGAFRGFYLGGEGNRVLAQMGFSASGISGKPEDRARDLERLAAMIQSRYGGMTEAIAGTFNGMIQQLKNRWAAFLMSATGPLFERVSSDLRRLLEWAGGGFDRLAARIAGPLARAWDVASAAAVKFFQTVEGQGWGKAFAGLWESAKPYIETAAKWLATAFWEAFKLALSAAAGGNPGAILALLYGSGKLGIPQAASSFAGGALMKMLLRGAAPAVGAAKGVTAGAGALTGLEFFPATATGAAAAPMAASALASGASIAAIAAAAAAAVGLLGGMYWSQKQFEKRPISTWNPVTREFAPRSWYERFSEAWSEGLIGGGGKGPGATWLYGEKAAGGQSVEESREQIRARETGTLAMARSRVATKGRDARELFEQLLTDTKDVTEAYREWQRAIYEPLHLGAKAFVDRLATESAAFTALPDTLGGMRGGFESALAEKVRTAGLAGAGSEEKIAAWGDDLKRLTEELGTLDALRAKSASDLVETYRKQLDVLTRQADVQLKIADEMDRMREKALGKTTDLLLMGPTERAKFMREEDWIKSLSPAELEAATASKRGREMFGKHNVRELLGDEKIGGWGRYAGLPELPESGASARKRAEEVGTTAAREKEKAALAAVPAVQRAFASVEVARIQVDLKGFTPDEIAPALAKALADARPQIVDSFRKLIAEMIAGENEKISRAQLSGEQL